MYFSTIPIFLVFTFLAFLNKKIKRYLTIFLSGHIILLFVLSAFFSFGYVKYLNRKYKSVLPKEKVKITGIVKSNGEEKKYTSCYTVIVKNLQNLKDVSFKLYVKKAENSVKLEYGDTIELEGKVELPSEARNYGGFNEYNYFKSKKLYGKIYANSENIKITGKSKLSLDMIAFFARDNIKQRLKAYLSEENINILVAVLLGQKDELAENTIEEFKKSNLMHLLCVSGAHVSALIIGINKITYFLGRNKKNIISIFIILVLFCITGFSASVTRASIMAIIPIIGKLLFKKSDTLNVLAISLIILLLYNPFVIYDLGFILSYAGTIGILLFANTISKIIHHLLKKENNCTGKFKKIKDYCCKIVATTASAQIILIPVIAYFFYTFSPMVLISNLIATPLFEIILYIGYVFILLLYIFPAICNFIKVLLNICIFIFEKSTQTSSLLTLSQIYIVRPNIWIIVIYYILLFLLYVIIKRRRFKQIKKYVEWIKNNAKKVITICTLITLIALTVDISIRDFTVYFIDVGQGDCTLIKTKSNRTIMIDSGGNENIEEYDIGKQVLVPYLLTRGIKKLDYIMVSHFHADHCNGFIEVINRIKIGAILIAKQDTYTKEFDTIKNIAQKRKVSIKYVKQGDKIKLDNSTTLEILYIGKDVNNLNNTSIMARIKYNNFSILFTGDAEKEEEEAILKACDNKTLKSNVLKVGHHGARTSSTQEFLDAVKPQIALIGVGEKNNFGHPSSEVINRLKSFNIEIYRTDQMGEITIKVNSKGEIKVKRKL